MTARPNTKLNPTRATALWIVDLPDLKPERKAVCREPKPCMITANLVPTNVLWIHARPLTPVRKRNVPTNTAKTAVSQAMSGTQAPKPAPKNATAAINMPVTVLEKPDTARPVTGCISHAPVRRIVTPGAVRRDVIIRINIPVPAREPCPEATAATVCIHIVPVKTKQRG